MRATRPVIYTRIGVLYGLFGLPSWGLLVMGKLFEGRNPHLLLALGGVPLGAFFLLYGRGILPINSKSAIAARIASIALFFAFLLLLSKLAVWAGADLLMTSVLFCGTAASYLSLVAFVFLVVATLRRKTASEET